jgi:hypothetical protein
MRLPRVDLFEIVSDERWQRAPDIRRGGFRPAVVTTTCRQPMSSGIQRIKPTWTDGSLPQIFNNLAMRSVGSHW